MSRKELTEEIIYIFSSSETLVSDSPQEEKVPVTSSIEIIEIDSSSSSGSSFHYQAQWNEENQDNTTMADKFQPRSSPGSSSVEVISSSYACTESRDVMEVITSAPVIEEIAPVPSDIVLDDSEFDSFIKARDSEMDRHLAWLKATSEYSQQFEEFPNTVENTVDQANTGHYL